MHEPEHPTHDLDLEDVRSDDVRSLLADLEDRAADNDTLALTTETFHRGGSITLRDSMGFPLFTLNLHAEPTPDEAAVEADEHEYQGPGE